MILAALHLTVEIVCVAFLAAFVLFTLAAWIERGARADRALADVETARARELPDQLGVEDCDPLYDQALDNEQWARWDRQVST